MRTPIYIFGILLPMLLAHSANSKSKSDQTWSADPKWVQCENSQDCTSIALGCGEWRPVNKKFAEAMKQKDLRACLANAPAGPQPTASCANNECVNDPPAVKDWKTLQQYQRTNLVDERITACQGSRSHIAANRMADLRAPFEQKIESLIKSGSTSQETPLKQLAETAMDCPAVAARLRLVLDRAESLRDWEFSEGYPFPIDVHFDSVFQDASKECAHDTDCAAGLTGCYRWVVVNKKYLKGPMGPHGGQVIEARSPHFCAKSHDPGLAPKVKCHGALCRPLGSRSRP